MNEPTPVVLADPDKTAAARAVLESRQADALALKRQAEEEIAQINEKLGHISRAEVLQERANKAKGGPDPAIRNYLKRQAETRAMRSQAVQDFMRNSGGVTPQQVIQAAKTASPLDQAMKATGKRGIGEGRPAPKPHQPLLGGIQ